MMVLVPSPTELVHPLPVTVRSGVGGVNSFFALGWLNTIVLTAEVHPVSRISRATTIVVLVHPCCFVSFIRVVLRSSPFCAQVNGFPRYCQSESVARMR